MTQQEYREEMEKFGRNIMEKLIDMQEAKLRLIQAELERNKFIERNKKNILPPSCHL